MTRSCPTAGGSLSIGGRAVAAWKWAPLLMANIVQSVLLGEPILTLPGVISDCNNPACLQCRLSAAPPLVGERLTGFSENSFALRFAVNGGLGVSELQPRSRGSACSGVPAVSVSEHPRGPTARANYVCILDWPGVDAATVGAIVVAELGKS